ncbi:MAG: DUF2142 domain-containing protein [Chloroflexota bacterium]
MKRRPVLYLVFAIYFLLALGYGAVNPLFEAPDEHSHYFQVQFIADVGQLPTVGLQPDPWLGQEAAQPPLYYLLATLVIAPLDTAGAREQVWRNPLARFGDASLPTNVNAFVHGPAERWPWRGYALAAHLLRAINALLGLGTLWFIYDSGRRLWPAAPERALLALGLVAFLPQFAFLHGSISNDPLVILLCTAALWQLLRLWQEGMSRPRLLFLGLTIGLAILTKAVGLLLLLYAIPVLLLTSHVSRFTFHTLRLITVWVLLPALLLSGWWLWRNWLLYGDPTAANQFALHFGGDRHYTLLDVLGESSSLWVSLFAVFGWFNLRAPDWVYWLWNGLVGLAVGGWAISSASRRLAALLASGKQQDPNPKSKIQNPKSLLGLWLLVVYAGLVRFMLITPAAQGRLLFPALLPMALALAGGLARVKGGALVVLPLTFATSLYCLLFVIPAAYAQPPTILPADVPAEATRLDADLGLGVTLVAAQVETTEARPGDLAWLTLYWQKTAASPSTFNLQPDESPLLVVELFGRQAALVGKYEGYHGRGLYPAALWPPGRVVVDRLAVRLDRATSAPAQVNVQARLVDGRSPAVVGAFKVVPAAWPAPSPTPLARLGDAIELAEVGFLVNGDMAAEIVARPGQVITVAVKWQVTTTPGGDLTTFVHLGDPNRPPLATGDSPPLGGDYPTHWWAGGEVITDTYTLTLPADLPAGDYPVWIGLYDPGSLARVPLTANGQRQPHDAYRVGRVEVTP